MTAAHAITVTQSTTSTSFSERIRRESGEEARARHAPRRCCARVLVRARDASSRILSSLGKIVCHVDGPARVDPRHRAVHHQVAPQAGERLAAAVAAERGVFPQLRVQLLGARVARALGRNANQPRRDLAARRRSAGSARVERLCRRRAAEREGSTVVGRRATRARRAARRRAECHGGGRERGQGRRQGRAAGGGELACGSWHAPQKRS